MDNWTWTDELVLEFARFTNHDAPTFQGRYTDLEQFKQSKQNSNKDWEIVESVKNAFSTEIKSVRRISDNEVFSVGDGCSGFGYEEISHFTIAGKEMVASFKSGIFSNIDFLFKKEKQKLFTTEDGVPKYPMDKCWVVNKDLKSGVHSWSDLPHNLNDLNWEFNECYYFHDEEKALAFLRKQKPLFTTEEKSEIIDQLNKLKSLIENNGER